MLRSELKQQLYRLSSRWTIRQETLDALEADLWLQFKDYHYNHLAGAVQYWIDNNEKFPAYTNLKKLIEKQKEFNEEKNSKETGLGYTLDKRCSSGLCTAIINHPDHTQSVCSRPICTNNPYMCREHNEWELDFRKKCRAHCKEITWHDGSTMLVLPGDKHIKPEKEKPVQPELINEEDLPF